jgi:hypothetical protein
MGPAANGELIAAAEAAGFEPLSITTERSQAITMKNPPHPGGVVLRQGIEPLGLTITGAAEALGVTRNTLSELVNGRRRIYPPKWPRDCPRFSAAPSKAGLCNRHSATLHKSAATG